MNEDLIAKLDWDRTIEREFEDREEPLTPLQIRNELFKLQKQLTPGIDTPKNFKITL